MGDEYTVPELKKLLGQVVSDFCSKSAIWKQPILDTFNELRNENWSAVIFGGTLRSLLLSRIDSEFRERPRDVDIVVAIDSADELQERFRPHIHRINRFGGLQLRRYIEKSDDREMNEFYPLDVWTLGSTWAFHQRESLLPRFSSLPDTTFFNIEAIAVEVWPAGNRRKIYSGEDQFFHGIASRTLEINFRENPYPGLCIVRALALAYRLRFKIGPILAQYISEFGGSLFSSDLERIQIEHYGNIYVGGSFLKRWIEMLTSVVNNGISGPISLAEVYHQQLLPFGGLDDAFSNIPVHEDNKIYLHRTA